MANLEDLKVTRATTKGSIKRIETHIDKNDVSITMAELECRLSLLEAYFKQALSVQDSIDALVTNTEPEGKRRSDLEELYIGIKTKILALMTDRKMAQSVNVKEDDVHNQTIYLQQSKSSNLVKLKLPKFSGQYTEYPNFIQQFTSRVDNDATISTIDKFTHLEDCLVGDAKLVIKSLIESIFKLAKLELRKWFSNDEQFIKNIPETEREKPLRINDLEIIKALGIVWEPVLDEFRFVNSIKENEQNITKRSVLSDLSRLFDPLGLVSPVVVLAKIFMQGLWILKLEWDALLPEDLAIQWRTYRSQLHNLNKVQIPRRIFSSEMVKCDLHGFSDASLRAYGCCIYTRCEDAGGNVVIRLLGAKSKVAPVSTESLPKLELNAALLLAKLLDRVSTSLKKQFDKIYLWTDSEIVLDWRKIKNILTSTVENRNLDMVASHKLVNNFTQIRRTFAYCILFCKNLQSRRNNVDLVFGPLSARELDDAFLKLIWCIQRQYFKAEINILEKCNLARDNGNLENGIVNLHKHSSIKALNAFLDTTSNLQLLKVGGRLRNSDLPDMTKYPILIPKNHPLISTQVRKHWYPSRDNDFG